MTGSSLNRGMRRGKPRRTRIYPVARPGEGGPPTIIRLTNPIPEKFARPPRLQRPPVRSSSPVLSFLLLFAIAVGGVGLWYLARPTGEIASPALVAEPEELAAFFPIPAPRVRSRIQYEVKSGETWQQVLAKFGADSYQSAIQKQLSASDDTEAHALKLKRGQLVELTFEASGFTKLRLPMSANREIVFKADQKGEFSSQIKKLAEISREKVLMGEISRLAPSFAQAAQEAGVEYEVVDDLVDLFSDKINFRRDFRIGDRFTVIFREQLIGDGYAIVPGPLLAAAIEVNGKEFSAIRFVGSDGVARYFDEHGHTTENSFLRYPLKFSRISSEFTYSRFHPVLKVNRPHNGVDFAAPTGTPVRAVASGVVVIAGNRGGSGNMVQIRHSERYETAYLHLSKITPGVKNGARVRRGDVIGAVGATGYATGPHLHFSFLDNGKYINPLSISLPTIDDLEKGAKIDPTYLARALFTLERYQEMSLFRLNPQASDE